MDTEQHNLTLLFVREGSLTVARCLEHDIVAQGQSIEEALSAWADVFAAQIIIDVRRGREPLEGIGPAPERYFDMFKRAKRLGSPARDRLRLRHVQAGQAPRLARRVVATPFGEVPAVREQIHSIAPARPRVAHRTRPDQTLRMRSVNIQEAKTHLSRLVEEAARGEEIVIAKAGRPYVRLVAYRAEDTPRVLGAWVDRVEIAEDFDAPSPEIEALFEGEPAPLARPRKRVDTREVSEVARPLRNVVSEDETVTSVELTPTTCRGD